MKKIIMMMLILSVGALLTAADNKVSMVTYFPTPYMAYQDINVAGPCDIGLVGSCNLKVDQQLKAGSVNVAAGKTLTLKGHDATAATLLSGNGSETRGSLVFEDGLRVNNLSGQVQSLEGAQGNLDSYLFLGSKKFPKCNATATTHDIHWKNLTLKDSAGNNHTGVYLTCGGGTGTGEGEGEDPEEPEPTCSVPSKTTETASCSFYANVPYKGESDDGSGASASSGNPIQGTKTRTFNTSTCQWGKWSQCQTKAYVSWGRFTKDYNKATCNGVSSSCPASILYRKCDGSTNSLPAGTCKVAYDNGCYIYECQLVSGQALE